MKNLKLREVKKLAQGHTGSSRDLELEHDNSEWSWHTDSPLAHAYSVCTMCLPCAVLRPSLLDVTTAPRGWVPILQMRKPRLREAVGHVVKVTQPRQEQGSESRSDVLCCVATLLSA